MNSAIKPTSTEGYLIRLYDTCEHLTTQVQSIEVKMGAVIVEEKSNQKLLETRMAVLESRMAQAESKNNGAKEVKSSIAPYVIAFASATFAALGYVILHFVGIK